MELRPWLNLIEKRGAGKRACFIDVLSGKPVILLSERSSVMRDSVHAIEELLCVHNGNII